MGSVECSLLPGSFWLVVVVSIRVLSMGRIDLGSVPLLFGSFWLGMLVSVRVSSMGQIGLRKLFPLDRNTLYHITMSKKKNQTIQNNVNINVNKPDFLTSRHKITPYRLTCH